MNAGEIDNDTRGWIMCLVSAIGQYAPILRKPVAADNPSSLHGRSQCYHYRYLHTVDSKQEEFQDRREPCLPVSVVWL